MNVRARLQRWWDKLLGRPPWYRDSNVTVSRSDLYSDATRAPRSGNAAPGNLTLSEDERPQNSRSHRAGVDPYANDGGFTKAGRGRRD